MISGMGKQRGIDEECQLWIYSSERCDMDYVTLRLHTRAHPHSLMTFGAFGALGGIAVLTDLDTIATASSYRG